MKKYFEYIFTSALLLLSVLMGLTFWLNTFFNFDLFFSEHWKILSTLQASKTPINPNFYLSFFVADAVFICGLYIIFRPKFRRFIKKETKYEPQPIIQQPTQNTTTEIVKQPQHLILPKNISAIRNKFEQEQQAENQKRDLKQQITDIFSSANFIVKKTPKIPNMDTCLFAIGSDETLWIGAIDCDIQTMQTAIENLQSVFSDTLDGVDINISSFILDTKNILDKNDSVHVFHNTEELNQFMTNNKNPEPEDKDLFEAFDGFINGVIDYISTK
ncbi:MAG: hypothetical protein MJ158_00605 [Alphaproteobacteria bacterium]|nr:hypothetical protein [Alphaproteobacteria bacterium]